MKVAGTGQKANRMTAQPIKFGTDGWRGRIGQDFTLENLKRVVQAYADYLKKKKNHNGKNEPGSKVFIGYDCRLLSDQGAILAAAIFEGNDFSSIVFDEPVPTPFVSWAVKEFEAVGGCVITASHNPPDYNGFKLKEPWGGSAPETVTREVEKLIDNSKTVFSFRPPKNDAREILDTFGTKYRRHITDLIDLDRLKASSSRIILDPMHGSGGRWAESFLTGGKISATTIRADRNPKFGGVNPEPIDLNLGALKAEVKKRKALVGIATDGDADRVGAVNELGDTMTMHEVAPILTLYLAKIRGMTGGIAATVSQSVVVKRIARSLGLPFFETPVGFKYIAELMIGEDILIGAEESGGIGLKNHIPERDGILNTLMFLEAVLAFDAEPSQIVKDIRREFGEFYYDRRDLPVDVEKGLEFVDSLRENPPENLGSLIEVNRSDGVKLIFKDDSWILFRQSGTEPVLRVYAEAGSTTGRDDLLDRGCSMALNYRPTVSSLFL